MPRPALPQKSDFRNERTTNDGLESYPTMPWHDPCFRTMQSVATVYRVIPRPARPGVIDGDFIGMKVDGRDSASDASAARVRMKGMPMPADLICFSHLRWSFVWQRPQHLMTRAAGARRVWFVEEPDHIDGASLLEVQPIASTLSVVVPRMPSTLTPAERAETTIRLLHKLGDLSGDQSPVHWYYSPMFREVAAGLPAGAIVYDCMDELSAFAGAPPEMRLWEAELLDAADVVFTGGASLFEAKRDRHANIHLFPSSVEVDHFQRARRPMADPEVQRNLPHPRIGFAGVIDERLDRELLAGVAARRPDYSFVLVGPVVKIPNDYLPRANNLHYVGMQAYHDLPRFLSNWDAAMLPFARNDATRFISPTKTPEYLAAGRPVVATSIQDVVRPYGELGLVHIADEPDSFADALDVALTGASTQWREAVDRHLSTLSWDRTWHEMHELILQAEARRGGATHVGAHEQHVTGRRSDDRVMAETDCAADRPPRASMG
jgi:glycosyltransferase involved in cell wall biosynthesis